MLLSEASKRQEKIEKDSKHTGFSARRNKNKNFSADKIAAITVEIRKPTKDEKKILKNQEQLVKKTAAEIKNTKEMTNRKHKSPMTRVGKRLKKFLELLKR
jgi:biopolymer transport protein ExbB/TolQ